MVEMQNTESAANAHVIAAVATEQRPWMVRIEEHPGWPVLSQLTVPLSAEVALKGFKIRDLVALKQGQVIESGWRETEDVPVKVGGVQVGWSEFEVVEQKLQVRMTRLA